MRVFECISAVIAVLLFFCTVLYASPPQSVYVTPAYGFTLATRSGYVDRAGIVSENTVTAGTNGRIMLFVTVPSLIASDVGRRTGVYDPQLGVRMFLSRWADLYTAAEVRMMMPFGGSMYNRKEPVRVGRGVNQLSAGFRTRYGTDFFFLHLSLFHHFLEAEGEGLYSSIKLDPRSGETYASIFGLNPFYSGSFLSPEKLSNDWYDISCTINSERFYPLIPAVTASYAAPYTGSRHADILLEGVGVSVVKLQGDVRYHITRLAFAGVYVWKSFLAGRSYPSWSTGITASVEF
ncbi:MAG: hypothetical protein ACOCWH_01725 [Spirochaetota bacterium]